MGHLTVAFEKVVVTKPLPPTSFMKLKDFPCCPSFVTFHFHARKVRSTNMNEFGRTDIEGQGSSLICTLVPSLIVLYEIVHEKVRGDMVAFLEIHLS